MEKSLKNNIHLNHFAVYLKLPQYYKSTIFQFLKLGVALLLIPVLF